MDEAKTNARRVLIIGAGFAGIEVARKLGAAGIAVTLIDRQNHHLFQPLLYQVATARTLACRHRRAGAQDAAPLPERRDRARRSRRHRLRGAHRDARPRPHLSVRHPRARDRRHAFLFRSRRMAEFAPGLKTIEDARRIRSRLLLAFERAEMSRDPAEQKRLMTIAVIGGGPTGVELAGSIAELARYTLAKDFHRIHAENATVLLLEAGPRILTAFPGRSRSLCRAQAGEARRHGAHELRRRAHRSGARRRRRRGDRHGPCDLGGGRARLGPRAAARRGPRPRRTGRGEPRPLRPRSREHLRARRHRLGAGRERQGPCPASPRSPSRKANISAAHWRGISCMEKRRSPFTFHNRGNTAIIGRHAAVFDFGWWRIKGWFAWAFWALIPRLPAGRLPAPPDGRDAMAVALRDV